MRILIFKLAAMSLALSASVAYAEDVIASSADGGFWLSGGVGLMNIEAHEYVWDGANKASQLDWDTKGVVLYSATAHADLGNDWTVKGKIDVGFGGNGHMVDYDWIPPFAADQSMDGWSDRSIHPDTRLDHYFSGSIEIGRDLFSDDRSTIGVNGGFKYTNVRWNAFGGSYIYSDGGVRNDIGELPAGTRGITYQQKIPTFFVGLDGAISLDRFTLSGGVKGGFTPGINDIDDHWLTQTRFYSDMKTAPVVMANAAVDYQLTPNASLYFAGNFENVFNKRGDARVIDTTTGGVTNYANASGASFKTMSLQIGLRGRF